MSPYYNDKEHPFYVDGVVQLLTEEQAEDLAEESDVSDAYDPNACKHTEIVPQGRFTFEAGEVDDNIVDVCADCGKIMDEVSDQLEIPFEF